MGFTVVRLPFSNEMLRPNTEVGKGGIDFSLNPSLRGLSPIQVRGGSVWHAVWLSQSGPLVANTLLPLLP